MKNIRWRIKDLIDLEYFLQLDETRLSESEQKSLMKRDREIYLNKIAPLEEKNKIVDPKGVIRIWLEQRRKSDKSDAESSNVSPGEAFAGIHRLTGYGLLILGLLIGSGLAFSLLNYSGTEPMNVSLYLSWVLLIQVLMILLLLGGLVIRKIGRSSVRSSFIFLLISGLLGTLFNKIKLRTFASVSQRGSLETVMGLIKGKRQIYGSLFYWPVFILAQLFGIGFNLGVLGATLIKVLGSDVAFGWQSTLQISGGVVFKIVTAMALPWSWFVPQSFAHPTLSQIEGSHMVLKDGIYHLATKDLVSWWPFLCLAVLVYGLLPRIVLGVAGLIAQKRAVEKVDFGHSACDKLLAKMRTPLVNMEGSRLDSEPLPDYGEAKLKNEAFKHEVGTNRGRIVALVSDDIFEMCERDEFENIILKTFGRSLQKMLRFGNDQQEDKSLLDELSLLKKEDNNISCLVLQEAWQPPIRENLQFLKDLRAVLGNKSMIQVGLIGRPKTHTIFTRTKDEEWDSWQRKLKSLGDPYLGLERLVKNSG